MRWIVARPRSSERPCDRKASSCLRHNTRSPARRSRDRLEQRHVTYDRIWKGTCDLWKPIKSTVTDLEHVTYGSQSYQPWLNWNNMWLIEANQINRVWIETCDLWKPIRSTESELEHVTYESQSDQPRLSWNNMWLMEANHINRLFEWRIYTGAVVLWCLDVRVTHICDVCGASEGRGRVVSVNNPQKTLNDSKASHIPDLSDDYWIKNLSTCAILCIILKEISCLF